MSINNVKRYLFKIYFDAENIDGFSFADLTISIDDIVFSTKNSSKDKLMIFITLTDLLYAWSEMILKKNKEYILLSISSSFTIKFKKYSDKLTISDKEKKVEIDFIEFTSILNDEINKINQITKKIINKDNSIDDFNNEFKKFNRIYNENISRVL